METAVPLIKPSGKKAFRREALRLLFVNLAITFLVFGMFRRMSYSEDAYQIIDSLDMLWYPVLWAGRVLAAVNHKIVLALGLHPVLDQVMGFLAATFTYALCATALTLRVKAFIKELTPVKLVAIDAAALFTFVNPYMTEWYHFKECATNMSIAYILVTIAVLLITYKRSWWCVLLSFVALMLGTNIYQMLFEYFAMYAILILFLQEDMRFGKALVLETLKILAMALLVSLLQIVITRYCNQALGYVDYRSGEESMEVIAYNLREIVRTFPGLFLGSYHLMPRYAFALYTVVASLGFLAAAAWQRKLKPAALIYSVLILLGCYSLPYFPHVISKDIDILMRTMTAAFAFASMATILLVSCLKNKKLIKCVMLMSVGFLLICAYSAQQYGADLFVKDTLDRQRAVEVGDAIKDYEAATGEKIEKVAAVTDVHPEVYHDYIKFGDASLRMLMPALTKDHWDIFVVLNYYNDLELQWAGVMPEEIQNQYFAGKDWDHFVPQEQMVIIDGVLYLAVY